MFFGLKIIFLCVLVNNLSSAQQPNGTFVTDQYTQGCLLPEYPSNGQWNVYKSSWTYSPRQYVPPGAVLRITCKSNYKVNGNAVSVCLEGEWSTNIGQCLQTCPSRYSTSIMKVSCTLYGVKLENCKDAVEGTVAKFECADFYEDHGLERHPVHVCSNGKWSHSLPECVPICGQKSTKKDITLIVGGRNATRGDYPWQVALYRTIDKELYCGGVLINTRQLITAAHCVTNDNGQLLPRDYYIVAVGKYFRKFNDTRDKRSAQFSTISEIFIPRQYKGDIQNFLGDIAIIITTRTFVLSTTVQPVCLDWGTSRQTILTSSYGFVSGWGYTVEHKNPSDVLKEVRVPFSSDEDCYNKIPEDFQRYFTDDKICAGFLNSSTSVCKGDSGGGLVIARKNRYYLLGIVSLSPQAETEEEGCNSQFYTLFTRVSYYIQDFILEKEALSRVSNFDETDCDNCTTTTVRTEIEINVQNKNKDDCVVPEYPPNGQWSISALNSTFSPGTFLPEGTILETTCNKNHILTGNNFTVCTNGKWVTGNSGIGQCLKLCPPIHNTQSTQVTCSFQNKTLDNCLQPIEGTTATFKCSPFYENLETAKTPVRLCTDGSWDLRKPECTPKCGEKPVNVQKLIINGRITYKNEYPWHVALYAEEEKLYICGGTLISQRIILTAAHCVTDLRGYLHPVKKFTVGVGKFYSKYETQETGAQFSKLENIFVPPEFAREATKYSGNIAILVTKKSFTLSRTVQPVCVDWGFNFINASIISKNVSGYITGWGFSAPNVISDELRDLKVNVVSESDCLKALPEYFQVYLTPDKFCAGLLNKSMSACNGDSGGALITKHLGRYYITGIMSDAPGTQEGCNSDQYTLFIKVWNFYNFILKKEALIESSNDNESENRGEKESSTKSELKTSCILPPQPRGGQWKVFEASSNYTENMEVPENTILILSCKERYKLNANPFILCINRQWSQNITDCSLTCPSVYSTPTTKAICIVGDEEFENCTEPIDGTRVKLICAPYYQNPKINTYTCKDGSWDYPLQHCKPNCGQKSVTPQLLIINGKTAQKGQYPWHVGIYNNSNKDFLCGGTLISPKVVLTAATCVERYYKNPNSTHFYIIGAGKYFRNFSDPREDKYIQYSEVEMIHLTSNYRGIPNALLGDLAILVATNPFILSSRVQPICVDWDLSFESTQAQSSNLTGYVVGWGYTSELGPFSEKLQELSVPIVKNKECASTLPKDYSRFLTYDKICAGYLNKGQSVCKGDGGSGLYVNFNGKYYITGVLSSAAVKNGVCDTQQYALYTKISIYIYNFILPNVFQYIKE